MCPQEPVPDTLVLLGSCGLTREAYWNVKELSPHTRVVFVSDDNTTECVEFPGESVPIVHDWNFATVREQLGGGDPRAFTQFVCGMGSPRIKKIMVERALRAGLTPGPTLISRLADVKPDAIVGRGGIFYPFSSVQSRVRIGDYVTLLRGSLGHDVVMGDYGIIVGNSVVAGHVTLGEGLYMGLGTMVRERLTIAPWVEVGMGAIVVRDVTEPGVTVVGNPAKILRPAPVAEFPRVSQEAE